MAIVPPGSLGKLQAAQAGRDAHRLVMNNYFVHMIMNSFLPW